MQDFRKLKVWQKCHDLTLSIYRDTRGFPSDERFGLVSQMREAAVSIESNIAEGSSRSTDSDFRRFLFMALGSLSELECQLLISRDLDFLKAAAFEPFKVRIVEIRRMLWPLVLRLSRGRSHGAV